MLSFSLQIDAAHPPSGAAEDSKKVQFSLDEAPQPIVTRIKKNPNEFGCNPRGTLTKGTWSKGTLAKEP